MDFSHFIKKRLLSPGPTTIPFQSQFAAVDNNPYHRSEAFYSIILDCHERLKVFFDTATNPLILTSSGTGSMEAALVNLTEPGSKILMVNGGKFADRWVKMAKTYQCEASVIEVPWGQSLSPDEMLTHLKKNPQVKAVFFQGIETSTGVYFPVKELAKTIRENSDALIVVDALSSLLAHEMKMDAWGIDCVFAASQKGFGVGTGLSFLAVSERARSRFSKRPRFYFNLEEEIRVQNSGKTAFTPASTLILSLQNSLKILTECGREGLYAYHRSMCEAVRAATQAMGFECFVKNNYAHSLTTLLLPKGIDGEKMRSNIQKKYAITIAGGQDQLKGKIIRIAHLGFVDPFDLLAAIGALELELKDMGYDVLTKGTSVFMKNFPIHGGK